MKKTLKKQKLALHRETLRTLTGAVMPTEGSPVVVSIEYCHSDACPPGLTQVGCGHTSGGGFCDHLCVDPDL